MFLCAVAYPRFIHVTNERNSGDKSGVRVTGEDYNNMVLDQLLPAIAEKWPCERHRNETIVIQHDGATPHKGTAGVKERAWNRFNLKVELKTQSAKSPTFNALDCGIFNSVQKKVFCCAPKNIDDLITAVESHFYTELRRKTIDNVCFFLYRLQ